MLENYRIEGFKSFCKSTFIDLKRTQYQLLESSNIRNGILKGNLFVGGNASGKTNAILPIKLLLMLFFDSDEIEWEDYICLFSPKKAIKMEFCFIISGARIEYSFHYQQKDKITIEELSVDGKSYVKRIGSHAETLITEKKHFEDIPQGISFLRDIWFNTHFRGFPILNEWFEYLRKSTYWNILEATHYCPNIDKQDRGILQFVKSNGVEPINHFLTESGFQYTLAYHPDESASDEKIRSNGSNTLYLRRKGIEKEIPLRLESLGNIILLTILPSYLATMKRGGMLVFDEFSSGLHNDLEELLIKYFFKHSKNAQLFIVTHSTNLLTSRLFRPDQLYAVNFDENGSNIVRFSDEQPRVGQNYEKMYLGGVFSGLPKYTEYNFK